MTGMLTHGMLDVFRRAGHIVLLTPFYAIGCSPEPVPDAPGRVASLDEVVTWIGGIALEETNDVVNVGISVHGSGTEGYVVADFDESQIRLYGSDGQLRFHFGREGDGPGEFASAATGAVKLPDESIFAVDLSGRIIRYLSADSIETIETPLGPVHDLAVLSPSYVVFAGQVGSTPERLHLYNIDERRVEKSFFRPGIPEHLQASARSAGLVSVDVRNDTLAAVFALTDTLYLFDDDGILLSKQSIPSMHYRQMEEGFENYSSPAEWLESFSMHSDVYHGPDGSFLIQYQDRKAMQPIWRLLRMTSDGDLLFESLDTPRLLTVVADTLVFVDPQSLTPDRWAFAQLR